MSCVIKDLDGICTLTLTDALGKEDLCVDEKDFCVCDEYEDCRKQCVSYVSENDEEI